jgi:hypothetical protein
MPVDLQNMEAPVVYERIESAIAEIIESKKRPICLDGDHRVTFSIVRAIGKRIQESRWFTLMHTPICTLITKAILTHMPARLRLFARKSWCSGWCRSGSER